MTLTEFLLTRITEDEERAQVTREMAQPYADHPDFREEWAQ